VHLTCPIRQVKGADGYGTEASKFGANPAYSTDDAEMELMYVIVCKHYILASSLVLVFAVCSYYRPVENLYFGTGFGRGQIRMFTQGVSKSSLFEGKTNVPAG
jgi:hypothetical protein